VVDAQKLQEADATIRYLHAVILAADTNLPQWAALGAFWTILLGAALLDVGCVLLLGEGLFLRMLGLAAVKRDGNKASRLRLLGRALLAWTPWVIGATLSLVLWLAWLPGSDTRVPALLWAVGILTALVLAGVTWAVWRPARSVPDLAAGTWLVPR
jgi:hypothetical protein